MEEPLSKFSHSIELINEPVHSDLRTQPCIKYIQLVRCKVNTFTGCSKCAVNPLLKRFSDNIAEWKHQNISAFWQHSSLFFFLIPLKITSHWAKQAQWIIQLKRISFLHTDE